MTKSCAKKSEIFVTFLSENISMRKMPPGLWKLDKELEGPLGFVGWLIANLIEDDEMSLIDVFEAIDSKR